MLGGLLGIVDGFIGLIIMTMNTLISTPAVEWCRSAVDNQWVATYTDPVPTDKGWAVVGDLATIIHYGLDVAAAVMAWLVPAAPPC